MSDFRTPTKKARGLGASGHAAGHWIAHRVSSIAIFLLAPVFVWMLAKSGAPDADAMRAFLASTPGAIVTLLTLSAAFYHMRLGMQVVIEDYIHKPGTKALLLVGNTLLTLGLGLVAAFCIIKIAL